MRIDSFYLYLTVLTAALNLSYTLYNLIKKVAERRERILRERIIRRQRREWNDLKYQTRKVR